MPLVKRRVDCPHLGGAVQPEGISSGPECVTNTTLSAIIRQLSCLSKQAEDVFGELFSEANAFYVRANTLQDRINRMTFKIMQLGSSVEEVFLQDINMRKAFRSATAQDQQVVSKSSIPNSVAEMYNSGDKPPSLNILSAYRDDNIEGMTFYTNPSYFFDLWKEKILQDTELKRQDKRMQSEQKLCVDRTMSREVIKVRKAHNRRQQWNVMALDKELRPDYRNPESLHQRAPSKGSLSPEIRTPPPPDHPLSLALAGSPYSLGTGEGRSQETQTITDRQTDLLSAKCMGIQLKKVQDHHSKHKRLSSDITTILSRRAAIEYIDTDGDSELHDNEWSD